MLLDFLVGFAPFPAWGLIMASYFRTFNVLVAAIVLMSHNAHAQQGAIPVAANTTHATFTTGAPESIWTLQNRVNSGLFYYPDMPIGVIHTRDDQGYLFFAPGTGKNETAQPNGVYVSLGTLDQFAPENTGPNGPEPSMKLGRLQTAPDGNYDRDYAGGGPTYVLNAPEHDLRGVVSAKSPILLQLYHGEYHPNAPSGQPFYGVSALAVSYDYGNSFTKIGEILSPHATLEEVTELKMSVTADGSLVEADENGYPVEGASADPNNVYIYSVFSDRAVPNSPSGFSVARVRKSDFISAVLNKKAPVFNKYYRTNATTRPTSPSDFFTQPGIGGNSTFIYSLAPNYIATPQVHYNPALHKFVLVYSQNQDSVWISTADNLFNWSPGQLLYMADTANPPIKVFYASAVGAGRDPSFLGRRFYVYFVAGQVPPNGNVWSGPNGTLMREEVTIPRQDLKASPSDDDR